MSTHYWVQANLQQSKCERCGKVRSGRVHSQPFAGCVKSGNELKGFIPAVLAATVPHLIHP